MVRLLLTLGGFLLLTRLLFGGRLLARERRLRERERAAAEREALAAWRAEEARGALLSAVRLVKLARKLTARG